MYRGEEGGGRADLVCLFLSVVARARGRVRVQGVEGLQWQEGGVRNERDEFGRRERWAASFVGRADEVVVVVVEGQ